MKTRILICGIALASGALVSATPLTEGTFTDIVRTVDVLAPADKSASPATLNEIVKAPDLVRTGPSSRAELTAPDQTLTRIGANTVFSFAPSGREIYLEKGSVLFHSPSGHGGGTIRSGGASAAVSGTTLIVATTPVAQPGEKNGFKVILLEGTGQVTLANGRHRTLKAGQMIFILPNHSDFGPLLTINLSKLVGGSALVNGFSHPLPSLELIEQAIQIQQAKLKKGLLTDTGTPADNFASNPPQVGNGTEGGPSSGDPNIYQIGVSYPPINNAKNGGPPFGTGPTLYPPPAFPEGAKASAPGPAPQPPPIPGVGGVIFTGAGSYSSSSTTLFISPVGMTLQALQEQFYINRPTLPLTPPIPPPPTNPILISAGLGTISHGSPPPPILPGATLAGPPR